MTERPPTADEIAFDKAQNDLVAACSAFNKALQAIWDRMDMKAIVALLPNESGDGPPSLHYAVFRLTTTVYTFRVETSLKHVPWWKSRVGI